MIAVPPWCSYWRDAAAVGEGGWDIVTIEAVRPHLRRRGVALDGGAHVGTWSRVLATDFARVVAVEPAPENAALLRQNTAHLPGVDVVEAALGSAPGETRVALVATQGVNSGQYAVGEIGRPVPMVTIDGLGLAGLGLIKLDLEGYELPALRGAVATLRRERPVVVVEDLGWERLHGLPVGGAAAFLRGLGYRVAARSGSDLILIPEG